MTHDCQIGQGEEDLDIILDALPERFDYALRDYTRLSDLIEIVLDLGRPLMVRLNGELPRVEKLGDDEVTREDLDKFLQTTTNFDGENR